MSLFDDQCEMLRIVALALGDEILHEVVFVGGCTTGLLLTDDYTREHVRSTDDVDLIVNVMGYVQYNAFTNRLKKRGFSEPSPLDDDMPTCAMKLGDLRVDLMPDDPNVLGYSSRWYAQALESYSERDIGEEIQINVITPPFFMATKLEAYLGRGENDPLSSRDIEDILNLVDGRKELLDEVKNMERPLKAYISEQLSSLLANPYFEMAVQSQALGDQGRIDVIYERLDLLIRIGT
ncbi:hypothetical protein [Vreelandella populi]|uniref:hypothetical protein n=1 Tax=Vreelandella populi TaxID=2498858 RepID=UPI000F8E15C9|nr:hypothetical protein [Halomonas populi]RUR55188.1 hypothetical protein ELY40_06605 [Halomonas populi]